MPEGLALVLTDERYLTAVSKASNAASKASESSMPEGIVLVATDESELY
jgi:hypothetical protein